MLEGTPRGKYAYYWEAWAKFVALMGMYERLFGIEFESDVLSCTNYTEKFVVKKQ